MKINEIAVIGAGISGAWITSRLIGAGLNVTVFDKARGAGGRSATRRIGDLEIDHGAQFIEAKSHQFQEFLEYLKDRDLVKDWQNYKLFCFDKTLNKQTQEIFPNKEKLYVGSPGMSQIARHLLYRANFISKKKITRLSRDLEIFSEKEALGKFDFVVSAIPPAQAAEILVDFPIAKYFSQIKMKSHFAALLVSEKKHDFGFDGMNIENSILNWIGVNSNKPGRKKFPLSLILHTNYLFYEESKSLSREEILQKMLLELKEITGFEDEAWLYSDLHRWLYGRTYKALGQDFVLDEEHKIAVCGDWLLGDNIEAAWTSANSLADEIIKKSTNKIEMTIPES